MTVPVAKPPPAPIHLAAIRNEDAPSADARGPLAVLAEPSGSASEGSAAHATFSVEGTEGVTLHVQSWRGATARGIFVISHGLKSHGGRYAEVARELTQRGWIVYAHDHRGHGKSGAEKVDVGAFDHFVQDLGTVLRAAQQRDPGLPVVLYGHSMGGQVAARFALDNKASIAGLILVAPAMGEPTGADKMKAGAARFLTWIGGGSLRVFELTSAGFSRDPKVTASIDSDPLVYGNGTARLATEIIASIRKTNERAGELAVPLLAIHGDADTITPARATEHFAGQVRQAAARFESLPGYFHDPLFDVDSRVPRQLVYDQADRWIPSK